MARRSRSTDKSLESTGRLWVEQGETGRGWVATVAPVMPYGGRYGYAVPDGLVDRLRVGGLVRVPWGRGDRIVEGFCIELEHREWEHTLRPIESVDERAVPIDAKLIALGEWLARYYVCPLGTTLKAMAPRAARRKAGFRRVLLGRLAESFDEDSIQSIRLGAKQRSVLHVLRGSSEFRPLTDILKDAEAGASTWKSLQSRGWVEVREIHEARRLPSFDELRDEPEFSLNADQRSAVKRVIRLIDDGAFRVALLFGVSGSGKTEVYVHAIRHVIASGRQVILLIPEIALTTQLVRRLSARFDDVAVMHSELTEADRSVLWHEIREGRRSLVIGTRSAVFAPCPNPGLIVVDEEQDTSFKNLQAPRYHVRSVAVKRGQIESIPVLLGSATPSLETWTNCDRLDHYERIDLPKRAMHQAMPAVEIIDMRTEYERRKRMVILSERLEIAIVETFQRSEQTILLINRRGFAQVVFCPSCRTRIVCPHCDVAMVFHATDDVARCHYCRERVNQPRICPNVSCRRPLVTRGVGTQRVMERIERLVPSARAARMDSDAMNHPREYRRVLDDFSQRRLDILVGTQMIAKGLDFPSVSLVGVVDAGVGGQSMDFRSGELQFQLITQVAGRAGRGTLPGRVIVQSMMPNAPALRFAANHDYATFAREELQFRAKTGYPPYSRLARVVLADERRERVMEESESLVARIMELADKIGQGDTKVEGPLPCAIPRLKNRYRYDVLIRCGSAGAMQRLMDHLTAEKVLRANVKSVMVDVDPVSLG